ncbi:unnamed protein product [Trichobilharzia regenti]|nr:unnamed protein product [Trichobilharzia regenti]
MRPIILNGHERPITRIAYNRDGDLIFTAAKNQSVCVWYSVNGERLGTYDQHEGAVWWLDVDWTTSMLLTASADWSCKIWDDCHIIALDKRDPTHVSNTKILLPLIILLQFLLITLYKFCYANVFTHNKDNICLTS